MKELSNQKRSAPQDLGLFHSNSTALDWSGGLWLYFRNKIFLNQWITCRDTIHYIVAFDVDECIQTPRIPSLQIYKAKY